MRLLTIGIAAAIAAFPCGASAQSLDDLTVGVRVRVRQFDDMRQRERIYDGDMVAHDSTRLVLRRGDAGPDTLPFFAMKSLQMQRGQTTRTNVVAIGAVTGMLAGGVILLASHLTPISPNPSDPSADNRKLRRLAVASIPTLAAVGIAVGMLADTKLWVSVNFPGSTGGND
jgi:hypothetical protein